MTDSGKTRDQLLAELAQARRTIAELRAAAREKGPAPCPQAPGVITRHQLYESMTEGLGVFELLTDEAGRAVDYRILDANPSFERHTGLPYPAFAGRLASELHGGAVPPYLDLYAPVARTGQPTVFETSFAPSGKHFRVSVFSPGPDRFAVIVQDVSDLKRAQQSVRNAEARHRLIVETANEGILIIDAQAVITYANPNMELMLGYQEDELMGRPFTDVLFEEDVPLHHAEAARRRCKLPSRFERRFRRKDGSELWTIFAGSPMLDEKGRYQGSFAMVTDITGRKRIQERLEQSEAKFRTIFDSINEFVFVHDPTTWSMVDVNQRACEVYGYTREEMLGLDVGALSSGAAPYVQANAEHKMKEAAAGRPQRFDWHARKKSGELFWIEVSLRKVTLDDRERLLISAWDISDRKKAQDTMLREKAFADAVMNSVPGLLYVYDDQGRLVRWNKRHETLTGYSAEELAGMRLADWYRDDPEELARIEAAVERIRTVGITEAEGSLRFKDGSRRLFYLTGVPLLVEGRHYFTGIGIDITDRKRMQELMVQTEKMISVGGLAAGMAHEINNPLSVILQSVEVVRNRLSKPTPATLRQAREHGCSFEALTAFMASRDIFSLLHGVSEAGRRAALIVSSMLEFSRKTESQMAPTDVNALLERAVGLCVHDYDLKKKYDFRKILIEKHFDADLPPVPCTATRIEQVVMNLLRNAAQAMGTAADEARAPRITLRTRRENERVIMEIADNGPGMPEDVAKRVFEPFFTTKKPGQGTGLGLSVSYFIITENHRGTMEVKSRPGQGSTFVIGLPVGEERD